ncbi:hypothetical protein QUV83_06485 [Cellulomonas cellasea]|uniref:hypothetical protein n=1 Tax=Cellulomonas cellasea TaxID=43670 RepID=UPI0025A46A26|nr:hypothetical protein [Cellulomonas cellasea]MDM8084407.1 hypothetical protein [Cellulomonas cellasea]
MPTDDHTQAASADQSRAVLHAAGATGLPPRPWQHPGQPLADLELVRHAAWLARNPEVEAEVLSAGLRLLESARAELDQIEAGLLFAARARGMTWPELSEALGLRSPQAAQQRFGRITDRVVGGRAT